MRNTQPVLVIQQDDGARTALISVLILLDFHVICAETAVEAKLLLLRRPRCILIDAGVEGGGELLQQALVAQPEVGLAVMAEKDDPRPAQLQTRVGCSILRRPVDLVTVRKFIQRFG